MFLSTTPRLFLWVKKRERPVKSSWSWKCVWSPRGQERGQVWPSIHHIVCQIANLGRAQSLSAHRPRLNEWKVKYAFKCKTEDWPGIVGCVIVGMWDFTVDPGNKWKGGPFLVLRSCIQAHVCRWWAVIQWLYTNFHATQCLENKLIAHSGGLCTAINQNLCNTVH